MLTKTEIAAIWKACDDLGSREVAKNFGRMVRFLLVTAQRRDEAASLRSWSYPRWRVAADHQQVGVGRTASSCRRWPVLVGQGGARDYVFAGRIGKMSGFSKLKTRTRQGIRRHRLAAARSAPNRGQQHAGVCGIRNEVVQAILNHAVPGVGGVYLRSELEKQKAEALATWATALTQIVRPVRGIA